MERILRQEDFRGDGDDSGSDYGTGFGWGECYGNILDVDGLGELNGFYSNLENGTGDGSGDDCHYDCFRSGLWGISHGKKIKRRRLLG